MFGYDESWELIRGRTLLLVKNGATGLILVVAVLFLFLNGRVAFWVAVGVPVSFMAALGVLYAVGGSINMVSLFALMMTLGIIVDDAIVVGEDALAQYQRGAGPLASAQAGARRMLAPVLSSSLTTIAAFLMLVGGIIGSILFDIPVVVICVILASLVESFFVLPGHLYHGFRRLSGKEAGAVRRRLDRGFERFRERVFRPLVDGRRRPALDGAELRAGRAAAQRRAGPGRAARVQLLPLPGGHDPERRSEVRRRDLTGPGGAFRHAPDSGTAGDGGALRRAAGPKSRSPASVRSRATTARIGSRGDQFADLMVELAEPDRRNTRNAGFIAAWRERIVRPPGLESLSLVEQRGGPPGRDVDVSLTGAEAGALKAAALELASAAGDGARCERRRGRPALRSGAGSSTG